MIEAFNPQLTALFIPVFLCRALLYLQSRPWSGWAALPVAARLAIAGHALLYANILAVLITGLLMMAAPWSLLGFLPIPQIVQDPARLAVVARLHHLLATGLACLVAGHLLFVLKHHIEGNPVLRRMYLSTIPPGVSAAVEG